MLEVNGVRTHYQLIPAQGVGGEPPVVVFVHGLGYDSLASFYLTLCPPVAAAGMTALAYDLRAHGRSGRPESGYRVSDFVEDLRALLDGLGVRRPVHLVGNSFGGTVAFSFAARYPGRVASIVSIEAEPATAGWAEKMGRTLGNVVSGIAQEEYLAWVTAEFGAHHARLARAAHALILATSIVSDVPSGPLLSAAELGRVSCPVLSILGDQGFQSDDLFAVEGLLPDCRTEVIEGQGHSVLVERHRTVREMVVGFVGEVGVGVAA